jgi:hypothetical protein
LARAKRSFSSTEVKLWILVRLYQEKDGMNANALQQSIPTSQEWNRFSSLLDELCEVGRIKKVAADNVRKGAVYFVITDLGRQTVNKIRHLQNEPDLKGFIPDLADTEN